MAITRSTGLYTGIGAYFCGNGYEGLTKELDATVQKEANLLVKTFNHAVEIRFNSDRESGGVWLKNSLKGFDGNCQVGFTAGLRVIRPQGMSNDNFHKSRRALPKELYITTYVKASALKDPSLANDGCGEPLSYKFHPNLDEALAWLVDNVDTDKILN